MAIGACPNTIAVILRCLSPPPLASAFQTACKTAAVITAIKTVVLNGRPHQKTQSFWEFARYEGFLKALRTSNIPEGLGPTRPLRGELVWKRRIMAASGLVNGGCHASLHRRRGSCSGFASVGVSGGQCQRNLPLSVWPQLRSIPTCPATRFAISKLRRRLSA